MSRFPLVLALLLPLFWADTARAQTLADYDYENLAFRGVGVEWGHIWPDRVDATAAYALRIDLGFLGPAVRVAPAVLFWSSELKRSEIARLARQLQELGAAVTADDLGPIEWSDLALVVDLQSVWFAPLGIQTFLGLGLGAHALNGQGQAIQDTFVEDLLDSITASAEVVAGLEVEPVQRFRLYAEARYTVMSDLQYPGLRVGGAIVFPARAAAPAPAR